MRTMKHMAGTRRVAGQTVAIAALLAVPVLAWAGVVNRVPEPETLALLGVGAVALVIARWARRK